MGDNVCHKVPECYTTHVEHCEPVFKKRCSEGHKKKTKKWRRDVTEILNIGEDEDSLGNEKLSTADILDILTEPHADDDEDDKPTRKEKRHIVDKIQKLLKKGKGDDCEVIPHGEQCEKVPFENCNQVEKCQKEIRRECKKVPDQKCWQEPHEKCWQVPHQRCWDETRDKCWDEAREKCEEKIHEDCKDVPKEECSNVSTEVCKKTPLEKCRKEPHEDCTDKPNEKCENVKVKVARKHCKKGKKIGDKLWKEGKKKGEKLWKEGKKTGEKLWKEGKKNGEKLLEKLLGKNGGYENEW